MWFFLALSSAVIYSLKGILEKRIIAHVNNYVIAFAVRFFALPFFFIPFFFNHNLLSGIHANAWQFWFALFMICCVNTPIETIFYYKALESEEATLVLPILTLGPALTVFFGSFLLKEIPSWQGVIGVVCIVLGIYALKLGHAKEGLLQPIHHLKNNKAIRMMGLVMLSQAIAGIFDKMGVTSTNAYVYGLANYIFVSSTLFAIALVKARKELPQVFTRSKDFLVIGVVIAAYTLLNFKALESGFVGYVSSIRGAYILFTLVLGFLFLKEKNILSKSFSGVLIVIGLVLIKFFS